MSLQSILGDSRAPSDGGFFGNIGAAFEAGISKIGSEVLPNWVSKQLNRQSTNQLNDTTYQSNAKSDLPNTGATTTPGLKKVFADMKIGSIGAGGLLIMGAILIAAIVVLKKV